MRSTEMKSYLSLIPISAKVRRRQNRMTILCIVLAVFLVTAVFSMADMAIRMETSNQLNKNGNWHIMVKDISPETAAELAAQEDVAAFSAYSDINASLTENYFAGDKRAALVGADDAILVTDRVLGGADTWATSTTIAGALRNLDYDLIITGRQAIDGDTAQVGPQIAEHLGLPVISYAADIKVDGDSVIVKRQYEDRYHELKAKMPCLVTALSELNQPRYMTPGGIFDACDKEVTVWGRADLKDVDDSDLGLKGSPTKIAKASDKVAKGAGEKVNLDPAESVAYLIGKFKEKHII